MPAKSGTDVALAARLLQEGKLVGVPTETVYGLAANALAPDAVAKIFAAKNRPTFNPLILHLHTAQQALNYVSEMPPLARQLAGIFWPGPLTMLMPRNNKVPDIVTNNAPQVAIRVPQHPLMRQLLKQLAFPLAAPSANPSGYISPTTAQHVLAQLENEVSYVLDGGPAMLGLESTIVAFEGEQVVVLRKGALPLEQLKEAVGTLILRDQVMNQQGAQPLPQAPGQLARHYAPRTQLVVGTAEQYAQQLTQPNTVLLTFSRTVTGIAAERQFRLTANGNMAEAAARLFRLLRQLDTQRFSLIIAEPVPEEGLGRAINDRLRRAAFSG